MIEDFPEKPTSLKIILCPCYWLITHKWNHPMVEHKDVHVAEGIQRKQFVRVNVLRQHCQTIQVSLLSILPEPQS